MFTDRSLFSLYTLTPLHAGAGESSGAIDLPVQREGHTEYPCVYSSGMKGSLRCYAETRGGPKGSKNFTAADVKEIFGDDGQTSGEGKVIFMDAKILLFPVRSSEGVFKWVTCPFVIDRLKNDLAVIGLPYTIPKVTLQGFAGQAWKEYDRALILEDFPIAVTKRNQEDDLIFTIFKALTAAHPGADGDILSERLVVVSDDVFKTLVTNATQIIARNVLDDDKKSKNLWYEECVPADTLFYTAMLPTYRVNESIIKLTGGIAGQIIQIGGNETIGYGLVGISKEMTVILSKIGGKK